MSSHIVVREDIRQMLIFSKYSDKFLYYMRLFNQKCLAKFIKEKTSEGCASSIMSKLQIDATEINSKIDSFLSNCT